MIEIEKWEVRVVKNPDPDEANENNLSWKVLNKIRFKERDPKKWGEFRAYGGAWTRRLNRSHEERDIFENHTKPDPSLKYNPRKTESHCQLSHSTNLPFWGLSLGPDKKDSVTWRIDNDQHMEIFYADVVPKVPRSDFESMKVLSDDNNSPDDPKTAKDKGDLARLGEYWDIIARDEPFSGSFQIGDYVEYWHRGEFQIRDPDTKNPLPQRKQINLRVNGLYPNWKYTPEIDETTGLMPARWESSISSSEDQFKTRHYPVRNITFRK